MRKTNSSLVFVLLGALLRCGAPLCKDPCPGAVRVEHTMINTQLGPEPVIQCTSRNGLVYSYPPVPDDEAACERHLSEWLRVDGRDASQ
jgi:hypothetical protein